MGNVVCCECVDTSTVGAIESCGKFSRLAEPGINFLNPFCCECPKPKLVRKRTIQPTNCKRWGYDTIQACMLAAATVQQYTAQPALSFHLWCLPNCHACV